MLIRVALAAISVALACAASSGCVSHRYQAITERAGPMQAASAASAASAAQPHAAANKKAPEAEVWLGSAPAGVQLQGDVVSVEAASREDLELVGRTVVTVEQDPPGYIAFPAVVCGMLSVVCTLPSFGWWIYYIMYGTINPPDGIKSAANKDKIIGMLKDEARVNSADAIVYVDLAPQATASQYVVGRGYLLRRRGPPPPSGGTTPLPTTTATPVSPAPSR